MKKDFYVVFIVVLCGLSSVNAFAVQNTLVLTMNTGATIDISQLPSILPNQTVTVSGDTATWKVSLSETFAQYSNYCSVGRHFDLQNNPLQLEYLVTSDGLIQISTQGDNHEDHLRVLMPPGYALNNYTTFNGQYLPQSQYNTPMGWWNADVHRNNLLAWLSRIIYDSLYDKGAITNGPDNSLELYQSDIQLRNHFDEKIVFVKSHIYHQQADYSWYNKAALPIHEMVNSLWSPIANNRNQNANLSRSFDLDYTNTSGIAVFIRAVTDNGMYSKVITKGFESISAFSKSGGSGRSYAVACNPQEKSCWVSNQNCAGSSITLTGNYPRRIEMNIRTTWSGSSTFAGIAVFGDIQTSNHDESPSPGDDNNPEPLYFELLPVSAETVAPALCHIYGVNDGQLNNAQFFTISSDEAHTVKKLGPLYKGYDIEAIAIDPKTNVIYAASGDNVENEQLKGHLYMLDSQTGKLSPVGSTGFDEIEDLAFSSDGTLWAWAKGENGGLITIVPTTGVGTLHTPSDIPIEGLTLSQEPGHTIFYGSVNTELWVYDTEPKTLEVACTNLLGETEGLEMMPDGILLMGIHKDKSFNLHAFNPKTCETVAEENVFSETFDDVEGIALPKDACTR